MATDLPNHDAIPVAAGTPSSGASTVTDVRAVDGPHSAPGPDAVATRTAAGETTGTAAAITPPGGIDAAARPVPVDPSALAQVAAGAHWDPHSILGAHPGPGGVTVRTLRPFATSVAAVLPGDVRVELAHEWDGIWVGVLPVGEVTDYRLAVRYEEGTAELLVDEPYRFLPTLGQVDLYLIGEGRHEQLWQALGAHVQHFGGIAFGPVQGTSFAVWAPNAQAVRVVGDFNHWVGRGHAMRSLGSSGVWELFIPDLGVGTRYKYEILGKDGHWRQKADPMAFATEVPPSTASVVTESTHDWADTE